MAIPKPSEAYAVVRRELEAYSPTLAAKPELIVANKVDVTGATKGVTALKRAAAKKDVIPISAVTGTGLKALIREIFTRLDSR